jgi:hypothetical protein
VKVREKPGFPEPEVQVTIQATMAWVFCDFQ